MRDDKILEFRNRFDLATQKLLDKDTKLREVQIERDKLESQFQKFKQSMLADSKRALEDSPKTAKEKQASKKSDWMKKREREEKSFVDANDYVLVCKKLKEVKAENQLLLSQLSSYKTQLSSATSTLNNLQIANENLERKA